MANSGSNNMGIFLGYGNISFTNQMIYSTGSSPLSIAVGDFNNDTRLDIVVANSADTNIGVLLGYGNGSFANQATYSTGLKFQPYSVAVADFNNDTFLDIIATNYDASNVIIFVGQDNSTFEERQVFSIGYGYNPFSIVIGDFNKDRKMDFPVANYGTDSLQIQLQTC
jgi:hypothetical protein